MLYRRFACVSGLEYENLLHCNIKPYFIFSLILNVCPASILPGRFAIFRTNPANPNATMDDLKAKHKKELKALDGEKRNQLKKTKATAGKGKKGKEALAA